jgi:hypothetical protein
MPTSRPKPELATGQRRRAVKAGLRPIRDPNSKNQRRKHYRALAERIKRETILDRIKAREYRYMKYSLPAEMRLQMQGLMEKTKALMEKRRKNQVRRITAEEVIQVESLLQKHKESGRYSQAGE